MPKTNILFMVMMIIRPEFLLQQHLFMSLCCRHSREKQTIPLLWQSEKWKNEKKKTDVQANATLRKHEKKEMYHFASFSKSFATDHALIACYYYLNKVWR